MTILIVTSLLFLVCCLVVGLEKKRHRAWLCVPLFLWSSFLLFFYMDAMVRAVSAVPPVHKYSSREFVNGVVAYRDSLIWLRFSLLEIVGALVLLVTMPAKK